MDDPSDRRALVDLHRHKGWPFLTWLLVDGRLQTDLELLLAKPGGVDIGTWWSLAHPGDVARARQVAARLGWSPNWSRQVIRHTSPVLCLWLSKPLGELTDADFDTAAEEAERLNVLPSTRDRFAGRAWRCASCASKTGSSTDRPGTPNPRPGSRPSTPPPSPSPISAETSSAMPRSSRRRCDPPPPRCASKPCGCWPIGWPNITPW